MRLARHICAQLVGTSGASPNFRNNIISMHHPIILADKICLDDCDLAITQMAQIISEPIQMMLDR